MLVLIQDDYDAMSREGARLVAEVVRRKPDCVLGLATGSTPLGMYRELIRMHQEEGLDFSKVTTFNLDEYVGLPPTHPQSYQYFMWENLFNHININPSYVHVPMSMAHIPTSGAVDFIEIERHCEWYEQKITEHGGIDLQILGVGANGHIAFNEPGSSLGSRTRIKTLDQKTRRDNARFFDHIDEVPRYAITMGVGTIMEAHRLLLLASGTAKADAIAATVDGPIMSRVPATIVQLHRFATVLVDREAASKLEGMHEGQEE